jgi:hypothetical protein
MPHKNQIKILQAKKFFTGKISNNCSSIKSFFLISIVGDGVQLGPLGTAATSRPILPAPYEYDDEEIGGMIGRGN